MSELIKARNGGQELHRKLLASVAALVLLASVYGINQSEAADNDAVHPAIWIELGGQSEQVNGFGDPFSPPFTSEIVGDGFTSPLKSQHALSQSFGGNSTVSFQPENSDWIFTASVLYGRANGGAANHEQTPGGPRYIKVGTHTGHLTPAHGTAKFSETRTNNNETHVVLDFQVGKDIGLGLFNAKGESTLNFGVRFAQFTSKQVFNLNADPDFYFPSNIAKYAYHHHAYEVASRMDRSFHGLGPSISWNASAPVIGDAYNGGVAVDWGVNAALLFGRQKAQGHHQTIGDYYKSKFFKYEVNDINHFERSANFGRSRAVIVPNVGGFVGASFRYSNAKVSFGYRADFFFDAMDGGVDTTRMENRGFYGPFANISVGFPQ